MHTRRSDRMGGMNAVCGVGGSFLIRLILFCIIGREIFQFFKALLHEHFRLDAKTLVS